jgi:hypothetical protein
VSLSFSSLSLTDRLLVTFTLFMAAARKKDLQTRWDAFIVPHDRRGFNDHLLIARFLSENVNREWPSMLETSLHVAYKLLGLRKPLPQGKAGCAAAIRSRIAALIDSERKDEEAAAQAADGAQDEEESKQQVESEPQQPADEARAQRRPAVGAPPTGVVPAMTVSTDQMDAAVAKFFTSIVFKHLNDSKQSESPSPSPTSTSTPDAAPASSSSSSSDESRTKSPPAKRDTISIGDKNTDEDGVADLEDVALKDASRKYVDASLQSLKARGCTLSQHMAEYGINVGWKTKRNRLEAIEVARLFDAVATETPTEIRRRLMARYVSLEEFDATGLSEVFEHVQAIGHSILATNIKQQLRRNMKRSTINTLDDDAPLSPKRSRKRQRHNNFNNNNAHYNHNNNNNNNNHNSYSQNNGNGRGGRGNFPKNSKPAANGQATAKQDGAGQQ